MERLLLAPFPDAVDEDVMDGKFKLPVTDASGRDRRVQRAAFDLLQSAGYAIRDGVMTGPNGQPLAFEVMTQNEGQEKMAIAINAHWPHSAFNWPSEPLTTPSISSVPRNLTMI